MKSKSTSPIGVGFGTTSTDYVPLAFQRKGAVWDLNSLRAGGISSATFTEAFVKITRDLVEEVLPEPCAMIALLMDESYSMEVVQAMVRDSMDTIVASTQLQSNQDYRVFVCTFGFVNTNTVKKGCSLGFDENDYVFERIGTMEDGWNAILYADEYFATLSEIEGMPLDQCDFVHKMMVLVTDEDRDNFNTSLSFERVANLLINNEWTITALLNQFVVPLMALGAVKTDQGYMVYQPRNDGSYSNTTVTTAPFGSGFGSTLEDYASLVDEAGGSVWDINQFRKGGSIAKAWTSAFEDSTVNQLIYPRK
jgi:hypothetical protein